MCRLSPDTAHLREKIERAFYNHTKDDLSKFAQACCRNMEHEAGLARNNRQCLFQQATNRPTKQLTDPHIR